MPRPTIDYLNARRALMPASGGKTYSRETEQCADNQLDLWEQTEHKIESMWSDLRINSQAYWDKVFAQFGLTQGYDLEESF